MKWRLTSPETKIEIVKKCWRPGLSARDLAREVSREIGEEVTHNAILGLYHRSRLHERLHGKTDPLRQCPLNTVNENLKLARERRPPPPPVVFKRKWKPPEKCKPKIRPAKVVKAKTKPEPESKPKLKPQLKPQPEFTTDAVTDITPDPVDFQAKHIEITELTEKTCRWPTERGEITWKFCGNDIKPGSKYCPYHDQKAKDQRGDVSLLTRHRWTTHVTVR